MKLKTYFNKNFNITKQYYCIVDQNSTKRYSQKFSKHVYIEENKVLIHYLGDPLAYIPFPHSNRKSSTLKPHHRTFKSTQNVIKEMICEHPTQTGLIYSKVNEKLSEELEDKISSNWSFQGCFFPRNKKQIRNFKYLLNKRIRLTSNEISSTLLLANSELKAFIKYIEIHPNIIVVLGHDEAISLANRLIERFLKDSKLEQVFSYDTTFELGDFYVSILVMKNTDFSQNPIFPLMFLIHDKKTKLTHLKFWQHVSSLININSNLPIVTDREKSLTSAIKKTPLSLFYRKNHILKDIKRFLHKSKLSKTKPYINAIRKLIDIEHESDFEKVLFSLKKSWNISFTNYFEKNVLDDLKNFCSKFNYKKFACFKTAPTNNQSESLNKMLKVKNDWYELPIDSMVLSLYEFQIKILQEFNKSYNLIGLYDLHPIYNFMENKLSISGCMAKSSTTIVNEIKKNFKFEIEKMEIQKNTTKKYLAYLCIKHNLVGWCGINYVFTVKSPINEEVNNVRVIDERFLCSCKMKNCYHVLAVSEVLNKKKRKEQPQTYKLTTLKRKINLESKGGRKLSKK